MSPVYKPTTLVAGEAVEISNPNGNGKLWATVVRVHRRTVPGSFSFGDSVTFDCNGRLVTLPASVVGR